MSAALPDAAWLAVQRWFRSKQRRIAEVREVDRARLLPSADLVVVEVTFQDGGAPEQYLVPLAGGAEPADGGGAWGSLAAAMTARGVLEGARGAFVAEPRAAGLASVRGAADSLAGLDERRLAVEQSNTSVVLGDRLILKLYRLLVPGENPDVEVGSFLADAGFSDTPAVIGVLRYQPDKGEPAAAAMLQQLVPSSGDGWAEMLRALREDPGRATEMAGTIGRLTRRMHTALASRPTDPNFPARVATPAETAEWRASAERQLAAAVAALAGEAHDRLVRLAPLVRARFADAFGRARGDELVTRIHGDYHLGQLLARHDGGFSVIDFEGEPARPLAERRRPASPLRDVAGLLRSLDYAARTAEPTPPDAAAIWLPEARQAFLEGYGVAGPLVEAFELEKACYEVRYEANNRPDWVRLPLAAVERLVDDRLRLDHHG